jgi:hypothetical protein
MFYSFGREILDGLFMRVAIRRKYTSGVWGMSSDRDEAGNYKFARVPVQFFAEHV